MYYIKLEKRARGGRQIYRSQKYLDKNHAYKVKELYCKDGEVIHLDYQYPNCKLIDYNNKNSDVMIVARKQPAFKDSTIFKPLLIHKWEYKMSLDTIFPTDDLFVYGILLSGLFDTPKYDKEHIINIPMAPYTSKQKDAIVRYSQKYLMGDSLMLPIIQALVFEMYEPKAALRAINVNKKNGQYYPYDLYEAVDSNHRDHMVRTLLNNISVNDLVGKYEGHVHPQYYNSHFMGNKFIVGRAEHTGLF